MKISVIITTHADRRQRLEKAIASVFDQTFQDFELIVVDDGSTDDTEKYCRKIEDERFRYLRSDKNSGNQAIPKNIGTKASKGEYLAYLDSDNTFRPDHLQVLLNEIEKNPSVDLVYGDRWLHDEDGNIKDQIGVWSDYSPQQLLQRNYIDTSDILIKREAVFAIGGWDERYKRMLDWNLVCRLAKNGSLMKRVPVIITDYNFHQGSISHEGAVEWNSYEVEVELPYLKKVKDPTLAIFTVMHDDAALPIVEKCFPSIKEKAGYPYYHLVVLNGDLPKTKAYLDGKVDKIVENKENMGIAHACNQAVDELKDKADIIWKIDGDCLFLSDDIGKTLIELYKKNHQMIWSPYPEGLINNAGGALRIAYGTLGGHLIGITRHVGGFCQFIPTKARVACRLPETKVLHFMEDLFMSQGVAKLGYGIAYCEDIRVRHILRP